MSFYNAKIAEIVQKDSRYAYEAYEFVFQGLHHTQKLLGKEPPKDHNPDRDGTEQYHISGPELLEGIRVLAQREFGLLARTVFRMWGVHKTDDFGEIVFNLVAAGLMSKTDEDNRADFRGVYDLDTALLDGFRIQLDEAR
jgi:uncharacterized repeat protein (TIGR04138 family)